MNVQAFRWIASQARLDQLYDPVRHHLGPGLRRRRGPRAQGVRHRRLDEGGAYVEDLAAEDAQREHVRRGRPPLGPPDFGRAELGAAVAGAGRGFDLVVTERLAFADVGDHRERSVIGHPGSLDRLLADHENVVRV